MDVAKIFVEMPSRYRPARAKRSMTCYFSVGDHRYTVFLDPEGCRVETGKKVDKADLVLKTTPELFERMVVHGKLPGAMDIALGRIKTNDPLALKDMRELFDFT